MQRTNPRKTENLILTWRCFDRLLKFFPAENVLVGFMVVPGGEAGVLGSGVNVLPAGSAVEGRSGPGAVVIVGRPPVRVVLVGALERIVGEHAAVGAGHDTRGTVPGVVEPEGEHFRVVRNNHLLVQSPAHACSDDSVNPDAAVVVTVIAHHQSCACTS